MSDQGSAGPEGGIGTVELGPTATATSSSTSTSTSTEAPTSSPTMLKAAMAASAGRATPTGRRPVGSRPSRALAAIASVLLVAVVAVGVVDFVRLVLDKPQTAAVNSTSSRDAVTAAVNAAKPMLAYDYKTTVAAKSSAAAPLLTAGCAAAYSKDLGLLASTLNPLKVVETAQVSSALGYAGVQSTADGEVTVLVFAVQTATSSRLTTPLVTPFQVSFTMVHQSGKWLVDGIVAKGTGGANNAVC